MARSAALQRIPLRTRGCSEAVAAPLPRRTAETLAAMHRALADPTRLQMLHILAAASEPVCVCDFVAAFDLGQPTISHHLAVLREAGMVTSVKKGIWSFHRLNPQMPAAARQALDALA